MRHELGGQPFSPGIGVWKTKPDPGAGKLADRADRIRELGRNLIGLMDEWRPQTVYIESLALGMKTSHSTVQTLGRVRGLVEGVCLQRGVEVVEVRPDIVKQAVTGRRDASKEAVAAMVGQMYFGRGVDVWRRNLDATDALAVAHVGAHRYGGRVTVTDNVVRFDDAEADGVFDF